MTDRKRFLHELGAELDAIDSQLDQYRAEFREESTFGNRHTPGELAQRREHLRKRSRELEDFDGAEWDSERREIEAARDELKRKLAQARDEASKRTQH
ncbi:MAG: hypothetical protein KY410_00275 [Proteobacteria bacterium]|nr:hypothetical protein [Pseudomonadota bacterium]